MHIEENDEVLEEAVDPVDGVDQVDEGAVVEVDTPGEAVDPVDGVDEVDEGAVVGVEAPGEAVEEGEALEEGNDGESDDGLEQVEMLGRDETRQAIYALLFVSDRPLSAPRIAEALGAIEPDIVVNLLDELEHEIEKLPLPYSLKVIAGGYQLVTKAEHAPYVRRLFQIKKSKRLSRAILETLAIIAYRQPVTRADVEAIRGVSVSHAFDTLQEKKLIKVSGVAELPGRPKLYKTTDEFLIHFGMKSLKELPTIEELRELG